jgi:hypothetical protein
MKRFELVKRDDHYGLYNEDGHKIAATIDGCNSKLSKENCDEIFGVVDVGALALEECNNTDPLRLDSVKYKQDPYFRIGYLKGYNKAMELNDKLFTVEDMLNMYNQAFDIGYNFGHESGDSEIGNIDFNEALQSLQQPTKIEVEIITEKFFKVEGNNGITIYAEAMKEFDERNDYKLDENGCLILKRI